MIYKRKDTGWVERRTQVEFLKSDVKNINCCNSNRYTTITQIDCNSNIFQVVNINHSEECIKYLYHFVIKKIKIILCKDFISELSAEARTSSSGSSYHILQLCVQLLVNINSTNNY